MSFIANIRDSRDLLVERNFGLLLLGQLVSQLGRTSTRWPFSGLSTSSPIAQRR